MELLRKYATATEIYFPLSAFGTTDFASTIIGGFAAGDVKISVDGTTNFAAANLPFQVGDITSKTWGLTLSAGEMTGKKIQAKIVDQTATKLWVDQMVELITFGNAAAELPFTYGDVEAKVDAIGIKVDGISADAILIKQNTVSIKAKTDLLFDVVQAETVTTDKIFADRTFDDGQAITLSGGPVNLYIRGCRGFLYIDNQCGAGNANIIVDGFEGSVVIYGNVSYNVTALTVRGLKGVLQLNHEVINANLYGCFGYLFGGAVSGVLTIKGGGGHNEITVSGSSSIDGFIEGATLDEVAVGVDDIQTTVNGISVLAVGIKADTVSILAVGAKEGTLSTVGAAIDQINIKVDGISADAVGIRQDTVSILANGAKEATVNLVGAAVLSVDAAVEAVGDAVEVVDDKVDAIGSDVISIEQATTSILSLGAKEATLVSVGADVDAVQVGVDDLQIKVDGISAKAIEIKQDTTSILNSVATVDDQVDEIVRRTLPMKRIWVDTVAGNDANDGKTRLTAKKTISGVNGGTAQFVDFEGGQLIVVGYVFNPYNENIVVPAKLELIGVPQDEPGSQPDENGELPKIYGTYVSQTTPIIRLKEGARMTGVWLGKSFNNLLDSIVWMAEDSEITRCYGIGTPPVGDAGTKFLINFRDITSGRIHHNYGLAGGGTIDHAIGTDYGSGFGKIFIDNNVFNSFVKDTIDLEVRTSAFTNIKNNSFLQVASTYHAIKLRPGRGVTIVNNAYGFADADFVLETGTAGTIPNLIQNNGRLANDANVVLTAAHGSGAWDAVNNNVTVMAIGANACQSIDTAIAPRFAGLEDNLNKEVLTRTSAGNPKTYKVGTGANEKTVEATYTSVEGVEKVSKEEVL